MKKLLIAICCMMVAAASQAQLPLSVEASVGMNFSKLDHDAYTNRAGLRIGLRAKLSTSLLMNRTYVNAGVFYSQKGAKIDFTPLEGPVEVRANYFDVPVHIGYQYSLAGIVKIFGEVGPYFGFGTGGKTKVAEIKSMPNDGGYPIDDPEIKTFKTFNVMNKFDWGLGARVGVQILKYTVSVGYDFGLKNLCKEPVTIARPGKGAVDYDLTDSFRNRSGYITVGYVF